MAGNSKYVRTRGADMTSLLTSYKNRNPLPALGVAGDHD